MPTNEYSKFKRLCKSVVSNANAKCLATIGYCESVNITFVECDFFSLFFHPSISEVNIPIYSNPLKYFSVY